MALHRKALALYKAAIDAVHTIEEHLAEHAAPTPATIISDASNVLADLTDAVYAARETETLLDNLRKRVSKLHTNLQIAACTVYRESDITELVEAGGAIGDYASGKPLIKTAVAAIRRDRMPELYDRFCREVLGITNESLIQSGAVEVHYAYFSEWLTQRLNDGEPMPACLLDQKQYQDMKFSVSKRRSLLDDTEL